jgi:hypothetical protein
MKLSQMGRLYQMTSRLLELSIQPVCLKTLDLATWINRVAISLFIKTNDNNRHCYGCLDLNQGPQLRSFFG